MFNDPMKWCTVGDYLVSANLLLGCENNSKCSNLPVLGDHTAPYFFRDRLPV